MDASAHVLVVDDHTAMLAAVSHDLRTPITSLRLHAELAEGLAGGRQPESSA